MVGIRNLYRLLQLVSRPERFANMKECQRVGLLRSGARRIGRFEYRLSLPPISRKIRLAHPGRMVLTVRAPETAHAWPRKIPITS